MSISNRIFKGAHRLKQAASIWQTKSGFSILLLRLFGGIVGAGILVWAIVCPVFRDSEGHLQGTFCLPFSLALVLFILGFTQRYKISVFWGALALMGQAVTLQMIDAGPTVHYQHYQTIQVLIAKSPFLVVFVVFQAIFVWIGFRKYWRNIRLWLIKTFKLWQLLGFGLIFSISSVAFSRSKSSYLAELIFATFLQVLNLLTVFLTVWSLPRYRVASIGGKINKILGSESDSIPKRLIRLDKFILIAAFLVFCITAFLSYFVYQWHPHIQDEVIYLYQAKYFANGLLKTPAYPVPEAFSIYLIPFNNSQWYSPFPPGWPALLALGVIFGIPGLVNPFLASLNILLAYWVIDNLYNVRFARLAVILLGTSPWFIFMGMNLMSHTFMLTCMLVATLGIILARKVGKSGWGGLAGVSVGLLSLIRPLDGLAIASLLGLWSIGVGGQRLKKSAVAAFILGGLMVGGLVFPYNQRITGSPFTFPLNDYYDDYFGPKTFALGFGPDRGLNWPIDPFPGYSPLEAIINAGLNISLLNIEMFGWSTGSLLFVALLLFSGKIRKKDLNMFSVIFTVAGMYSLFWFAGGPDFGARYWYLMIVPLIILSVRGIEELFHTVNPITNVSDIREVRVLLLVFVLCFITLINYFPWRALDKYYHYLNMRPDIPLLAEKFGFGRSIVLIKGESQPDYASAWIFNPLDPYADQPIYANDINSDIRKKILVAYQDRPVWVVDGPSITNKGYAIVQGPVSAKKLLLSTK